MTLFKNKYRIESTRLQSYDYSSQGAYFITVCTKNRECLFGEISDGLMNLNDFGEIVLNCWHDLPNHYANIILDVFVIMPNHVHGLIIIVETGFKPVCTKPVSTMELANTTVTASKPNHENEGTGTFFVGQRA